MKKLISIVLSLFIMLSLCSVKILAANDKNDLSEIELPKPSMPQYFVFDNERESDEGSDSLRMICLTDEKVLALSSKAYRDSEGFYEKYSIDSFSFYMQYDVSLDGENNWQYTSEWDENYSMGSYAHGYDSIGLGDEMMDDFELFSLCHYEGEGSGNCSPYEKAGAIITDKHTHDDGSEYETYHFDLDNHSLYIRCRYYMEWKPYDKATDTYGEVQRNISEWSDTVAFDKEHQGISPEEPSTYEAPVISDLKIVLPDEYSTNSYLAYVQNTPESVYLANVYYRLTDNGEFEGLETQVSVNGGEWEEFFTANSDGDWCLSNGNRTAHKEDSGIVEDTNVKLRVRFLGSNGPSEWSNVLEMNGGGTNALKDTKQKSESKSVTEKHKCSLCRFCSVPLGLCIFIWLAIILVVIILVVIIILITKKKTCPSCKAKVNKGEKLCPKCGEEIKNR